MRAGTRCTGTSAAAALVSSCLVVMLEDGCKLCSTRRIAASLRCRRLCVLAVLAIQYTWRRALNAQLKRHAILLNHRLIEQGRKQRVSSTPSKNLATSSMGGSKFKFVYIPADT